MRRIKECLRFYYEVRLSQSAIARALSIARSTVGDYIERARKTGRSWPDLNALSDEQLETLLFAAPAQNPDEKLPLPAEPFEYREWSFPTVAFDYHIGVDNHYYSVPWALAKQKVSVRVTENAVEVFHRQERVALHQRSHAAYQYTTLTGHMPPAHQKMIEWTPARLYKWADQIGTSTRRLIEKVIKTKFHPQQGFRPAMGILRSGKIYGDDRLEAAAAIALTFGFTRVQQITDLLRNGRDKQTAQGPTATVENRENIRGRTYYTEQQTTLPL